MTKQLPEGPIAPASPAALAAQRWANRSRAGAAEPPTVTTVPPGVSGRAQEDATEWTSRARRLPTLGKGASRDARTSPPVTAMEELKARAGRRAREYWAREKAARPKSGAAQCSEETPKVKEVDPVAPKSKKTEMTEQERRVQKQAYEREYRLRRKAAGGRPLRSAPEGGGSGITLLIGGSQVTLEPAGSAILIRIEPQK